MSMQGRTIRILEAASFTTPQAVAIAEAIDTGIRSADLVTVPVLDSRFAQMETKLAQTELRLIQRMDEKLADVSQKISSRFWALLGLGLTATGIIIGAFRYMH